ncbi:MAG: 30S ribosomal protein S9 [Bacteroidia bacterium]
MEVNNAIGRRKTAVARAYLKPGSGNIVVNKKELNQYFPTITLQNAATKALEVTETKGQFDAVVHVNGGGPSGQADAVKLAIARALIRYNEELKPALKTAGLTTRDPRMVERKKSGQKKARKRFQFVKR